MIKKIGILNELRISISNRRKELKLTLSELSQKANVGTSLISNIEKGRVRSVKEITLDKLLNALSLAESASGYLGNKLKVGILSLQDTSDLSKFLDSVAGLPGAKDFTLETYELFFLIEGVREKRFDIILLDARNARKHSEELVSIAILSEEFHFCASRSQKENIKKLEVLTKFFQAIFTTETSFEKTDLKLMFFPQWILF